MTNPDAAAAPSVSSSAPTDERCVNCGVLNSQHPTTAAGFPPPIIHMTSSPLPTAGFRVVYARDCAQYVAERGDIRVKPSIWPPQTADHDAKTRAAELCDILNRVYGVEERLCDT